MCSDVAGRVGLGSPLPSRSIGNSENGEPNSQNSQPKIAYRDTVDPKLLAELEAVLGPCPEDFDPDKRFTPDEWKRASDEMKAWSVRTGEVCFTGAAGTGKTINICQLLHRIAVEWAGVRILVAREFREDHTQSTMKTLENEVIPASVFGDANSTKPVRWHGGEQAYLYSNGSEIVIKGLRDGRGIYSQQYDIIFVNEAGSIEEEDYDQLLRAKRNRRCQLSLLITDLNPEFELHWLHQRCDEGVTTEVLTTHADNPTISAAYLADLYRMRDPVQRQRLALGQRVAALPGAYYQAQLAEARYGNPSRFLTIIPQRNVLTHTCWDLGRSDYTAIWWFQRVRGEWHWIDYYESNLEELEHYMRLLQQVQLERRLLYGSHCLPHDAAHKTLASRGESVQTLLWDLGLTGDLIVPQTSVHVQHAAVRTAIATSYFDTGHWQKPTDPSERWRRGVRFGVTRLAAYRAAKNKTLNVLRPHPEHDEASHGASAFAMGVLADPSDGNETPTQQGQRDVTYLGGGGSAIVPEGLPYNRVRERPATDRPW